jgi:DNA-binding XRE family transcriptional regulator
MLIKEYIVKNGLKISFFAECLGVTRQSLSSIIQGKHSPSLELAMLIEEKTKGKVRCKDIHKPRMLKKKHDEEANAEKKNH